MSTVTPNLGLKKYELTDVWHLTDQCGNLDIIDGALGNPDELLTTDKVSVVGALNELFTSASDGKELIATAITGKGGTATGSDTFADLAAEISNVASWDADLIPENILVGKNIFGVVGTQSPLVTEAGTEVIAASSTSMPVITSSNYTKYKEVQVLHKGSVEVQFRIKIDSPSDGATTVFGQIYKNGVPVGTERSHTEAINQTGYSAFSENIEVSAGDLIQIWGRKEGATACSIGYLYVRIKQPAYAVLIL